MPDIDLNDDQLKLVRYRILFVKRDLEVAFPHADVLVYDNLSSSTFAAWKVAEFIEGIASKRVPREWGGGDDATHRPTYPKAAAFDRGEWRIRRLNEDDYKYLRVSYEVVDRYDREELQYRESQLTVLREIRDRLRPEHHGCGEPMPATEAQ